MITTILFFLEIAVTNEISLSLFERKSITSYPRKKTVMYTDDNLMPFVHLETKL